MRFFVYWKQRAQVTDYDLSVLLLDDEFLFAGQVSWTNLSVHGAVHSGDITEAPDGATEFIDLDLGQLAARYVIPQVNVYSGEGFDAVEEVFFGFMERTPDQRGRPFEPRTVRAKSDLFGGAACRCPCSSRVRMTGAGTRSGCISGWAGTRSSIASRATGAARRGWCGRSRSGATSSSATWKVFCARAARRSASGVDLDQPVTFLGLERPDELPAGSVAYTPANLEELLNSA